MSESPAFPTVDLAAWRAQVERELQGRSFERELVTALPFGLDVEPLYTAIDLPHPLERPPGARPVGASRSVPRHAAGAAADVRALVAEDVTGGAAGVWLRVADGFGDGGVTVGGAAELRSILDPVIAAEGCVLLDAGEAGRAVAEGLAEEVGALPPRLCLITDPLATRARRGRGAASIDQVLEDMARVASDFARDGYGARAVGISSAPYHDAGCDAAQELGYLLATAARYLRAMCDLDLPLSAAAAQITLQMPLSSDLFVEVAKLRAARLLWDRLLRACGGAPGQAAWIHAFTSVRTATRRDVEVNALRASTQVLAALLGEADLITAIGFDEVTTGGTATSRRLARNTPIILSEESGLGGVRDAVAGSYYVEVLTERLARAAWEVMREVERQGGMDAALRSGSVQRAVETSWRSRMESVTRRRTAIVGVSMFARIDEDASASREPPVAAAPTSGEVEPLPMRRDADPFERIRDAVDAIAASRPRPAVFLAGVGPPRAHKPRADFMTDLFAAGGFATVGLGASDAKARSPSELADAFAASGARAACVVASDDDLAAAGAVTVRALKERGAAYVMCAGRPGALEADLRDAGADAFAYLGGDAAALLAALLDVYISPEGVS